MLSILGRPDKKSGFCDRLSRRGFLQIGGAAMGGLALNQILEMEARAGVGSNQRAIINVYLPGGPPHIDMWDLKPDAPPEIRGEFKPIETNVPGIEICELFPQIAPMMDKFVIIRSLGDSDGGHDALPVHDRPQARRTRAARRLAGGRVVGVAGCRGRSNPAMPPHLSLMYPTGNRPGATPATAASSAWPTPRSTSSAARPARSRTTWCSTASRSSGCTIASAAARRSTASAAARRGGAMDGMDAFNQQALGILTVVQAGRRARPVEGRPARSSSATARRPGVRARRRAAHGRELLHRPPAGRSRAPACVTMNFSRWDWHGPDGKNFVAGAEGHAAARSAVCRPW